MARFNRKEANSVIKAFCVQFAILYNFNVNYKVSIDGKLLTGDTYYFDFFGAMFMNIRKKDISSGDGVTLKKRRLDAPVSDLWNEILQPPKD